MTMALGALQAQAQKAVRDLHRALDTPAAALPVQIERVAAGVGFQVGGLGRVLFHERLHFLRPVLLGAALAAGSQENALGQAVIWHIFLHSGAKPFVEAARLRLFGEAETCVETARPQNVTELRRP